MSDSLSNSPSGDLQTGGLETGVLKTGHIDADVRKEAIARDFQTPIPGQDLPRATPPQAEEGAGAARRQQQHVFQIWLSGTLREVSTAGRLLPEP